MILLVSDQGRGLPDDVSNAKTGTGGRVGVGIAGMRESVRQSRNNRQDNVAGRGCPDSCAREIPAPALTDASASGQFAGEIFCISTVVVTNRLSELDQSSRILDDNHFPLGF